MKDFFNRYKKTLVIGGILSLILTIWLIITLEGETSPPPIETRDPPEETPVTQQDPLIVEKTNPPSGTTVTTLSDTIVIYFNAEIDMNSLSYSVKPEISLATETYENKKELHIFPSKEWWEDGVTYTLRINSLKGTNGEVLKEPFVYKYTRNPAENLPVGDPPPEKTGNEF